VFPYSLTLSRNISVTDRQTDDGRTTNTTQARPLVKYGRPKKGCPTLWSRSANE